MKQILLIVLIMISLSGKAQSVVQSINSGSIISANSSISIGEIVVIPESQNQSSSGIIGILAQVNDQTLEVPQLELSDRITVFPNPTTSIITFETNLDLANEKVSVVNISGQVVVKKQISSSNSLDLTDISNGVYFIQFENKNINAFKIIKR